MPLFTSSIELSDDYPSIRPSLNLNFAGSRALDPRITFTRASVGTYVDGNGQFKTAGNDEARFDHDPLTLESLGLLIEESRTNLVNDSTNNSSWNVVASAVNETTYPIKGLATTRVADSPSDGDSPYLGCSNFGTGSSISMCMSIYVDAVNSTSDTITLFLFGSGYINHTWNISTGVPVPTESFSINGSNYNSGSQEFIDCGGGIYRLILKANYIGSVTTTARFYLAPSGGASDYCIVAGAQMEQGAFPTSYIPTSGTAATRAQDTPLITGTNFTDFYNQSEGTLVLSADIGYLPVSNQSAVVFENTSSQSTDLIALGYRVGGGASGNLGGWYQGNGATATFKDHSVGVTVNSEFRQAFAYKTDDLASVVNGTTPLTDNSGTLSTSIDRVRFGEYYSDGMTSGHIRQFKYYPKRLTNAQLQLLTS